MESTNSQQLINRLSTLTAELRKKKCNLSCGDYKFNFKKFNTKHEAIFYCCNKYCKTKAILSINSVENLLQGKENVYFTINSQKHKHTSEENKTNGTTLPLQSEIVN